MGPRKYASLDLDAFAHLIAQRSVVGPKIHRARSRRVPSSAAASTGGETPSSFIPEQFQSPSEKYSFHFASAT